MDIAKPKREKPKDNKGKERKDREVKGFNVQAKKLIKMSLVYHTDQTNNKIKRGKRNKKPTSN